MNDNDVNDSHAEIAFFSKLRRQAKSFFFEVCLSDESSGECRGYNFTPLDNGWGTIASDWKVGVLRELLFIDLCWNICRLFKKLRAIEFFADIF